MTEKQIKEKMRVYGYLALCHVIQVQMTPSKIVTLLVRLRKILYGERSSKWYQQEFETKERLGERSRIKYQRNNIEPLDKPLDRNYFKGLI